MSPFSPLSEIINFSAKLGTVLGNNLATGQPVGTNVANVLSKPTAPIIINNPAKSGSFFGGDFKIGFIEKNLIIVGFFALGAFALYRVIK